MMTTSKIRPLHYAEKVGNGGITVFISLFVTKTVHGQTEDSKGYSNLMFDTFKNISFS